MCLFSEHENVNYFGGVERRKVSGGNMDRNNVLPFSLSLSSSLAAAHFINRQAAPR